MFSKLKAVFLICFSLAFSNLDAQVFSNLFTKGDSITQKGKHYLTWSIDFELGRAELRKDTVPVLDSIAVFLLSHTGLTLEIQGHTDTRASRASSNPLSGPRAESVNAYLIKKGVSPERLKPRGYQGFVPLIPAEKIAKVKNKQKQEEMHRVNRRIEFVILQ